jgi:hypothetical protein
MCTLYSLRLFFHCGSTALFPFFRLSWKSGRPYHYHPKLIRVKSSNKGTTTTSVPLTSMLLEVLCCSFVEEGHFFSLGLASFNPTFISNLKQCRLEHKSLLNTKTKCIPCTDYVFSFIVDQQLFSLFFVYHGSQAGLIIIILN